LNIIHKLLERKGMPHLYLADPNHTDKIAGQTPLFYAAREGHLDMCKILIEAGCDLALQDTLHKTAHHYAKRNGKTDVADYLFNEYQTLKEQRKIQTDSRQESNIEERTTKKSKTKKDGGSSQPNKAQYRLYRSDAFGNANEVSTG